MLLTFEFISAFLSCSAFSTCKAAEAQASSAKNTAEVSEAHMVYPASFQQ
jgi:hypothetical protein